MNKLEISNIDTVKCIDNSLNLVVTCAEPDNVFRTFITNISKDLFDVISHDIEKLKDYAIGRIEKGDYYTFHFKKLAKV
ncbi:hypothetical protein [Photobacterium damselae]|uniref:hypothetical protein n=1 Tax=Photobacterium damselae TaxID=38293 RepID=UPI001F46BCBC|nr:hypothetical protein [Photobacterium damselae]UKA04789.1 hypothetical protein IHC89_21340 [Photobacterium damselae subsp. damselae]